MVTLMAGKPCQVGATGFCQGGVLSFIAAQHAGISAAAPFYGFPQASTITCLREVAGRCKLHLSVGLNKPVASVSATESRLPSVCAETRIQGSLPGGEDQGTFADARGHVCGCVLPAH